MGIERVILININRFNEALGTLSREGKNPREYRVLLNCKTGEMSFRKSIRDLGSSLSLMKNSEASALKEVRLIVRDYPNGTSSFEIRDHEDHLLESPDDQGVVKKTLKILNFEAQKIHEIAAGILPEKRVLQTFFMGEEIRRLPGWVGNLSIPEAEERLSGTKIGTYLIRFGDEVTSMIDEMREKYGEIHAYSVLFSDEEEKVSERLILHVSWGWLIQDDEPDLKSHSYRVFASAQELLNHLHPLIQEPIKNALQS